MEYIGNDFDGDMKLIADHEETRKWWKIMEEFQVPLSWQGAPPSQGGSGGTGSWWEPLEELFHNKHEPTSFAKKD